MARANWEYIRVDVLLPEHPKLDGLSPAAKWVLIEMWCYCGRLRTDGIITADRWKAFGTSAIRQQIIKHDLAHEMQLGGYLIHDFTEHNRSRAEIDELSARRATAGRKGGRSKPQASALASALANAKHVLRGCLRTEQAEAEAEADPWCYAPTETPHQPPTGALILSLS